MNYIVDHRQKQRHNWRRQAARFILFVVSLALLAVLLGASSATAAPANSNGSAGPWEAWYWNNTSLSGAPVLYRLEEAPGVDAGSGSPVGGVGADFSALWIGVIDAASSGQYTFAAEVDDGVRLWVDNRLVLDAWQPGSARVVANTISLSTGFHTVRVEYFDARDTALLRLEWGPQGTVDLAGQPGVPAPPPAPGAAPVPQGQALSIGDDFMGGGPLATVGRQFSLNARTGPGIAYPVVTVVAGGTPVEMLYRWEAGRWIAVQMPNGVVGWVNATYLNANFATGNLPEWRADPQRVASPAVGAVVPPTPAHTPAPITGSGPLATMTGAYVLNLRSGPGVGYPVVTTISRGATVEMLYRWGAGLWVAVRTPGGAVGWLNATYLSADFATGNLPEWRADPQTVATLPW